MEYSLDLNENQYEVRTLTMGETTIRFRAFEDLVYVRHPVDLEHQKLNLYIPEDYYEGKTIHGYTGKTVPIFFPNASGAYASGPADRPGPNFRLWGRGKPNGIFYALAAGFVVAAPGSRGRTVQDENGDFLGCAPAHIVDLKAAVRYLRHNKDRILGDTEHIIRNGTTSLPPAATRPSWIWSMPIWPMSGCSTGSIIMSSTSSKISVESFMNPLWKGI